jgi:polyisoprenoid-binding protein YceI
MAWQIDPTHSSIEFSVRHMMISKVRGQFDKFSGEINIDEDNPERSTIDIHIDAASINTRESQRDAHLRSADFLHADLYPTLNFRSTKIETTGKNKARMHGALTIRDVSKAVAVDVEFVGQSKSPWGALVYGFTGSTKINRKEWGLVWNVALETGGVLVGEEITVNIELEVIKTLEQQPEMEPELALA